MRPVKFNCGLPTTDFAAMTAMARQAEDLGFFSVSIDDHFFMRGLMSSPTHRISNATRRSPRSPR